jgi:hypothetical protein
MKCNSLSKILEVEKNGGGRFLPKESEQIMCNLQILANLPVHHGNNRDYVTYNRRAMCLLRLHQYMSVHEIARICRELDIYIPTHSQRHRGIDISIQGLIGEAFRYVCMQNKCCVFRKTFSEIHRFSLPRSSRSCH